LTALFPINVGGNSYYQRTWFVLVEDEIGRRLEFAVDCMTYTSRQVIISSTPNLYNRLILLNRRTHFLKDRNEANQRQRD